MLRRRHGTESYEDRAFSPWYARNGVDSKLVMLDRLPQQR
jgi:hypothetical protein